MEARRTTNKIPIALPKADATQPASAQMVSHDVGLQLAVGSRVRIVTTSPVQSTVEGTIYTTDPITNLVVLNTSTQASNILPSSLTPPAGSYRFIPISQISSFQLLSLPQSSNDKPITAQNTLDTNALGARLQRNINAAQATQARQGPKGTSTVDQAVFDALSRTHPTRWQGSSMIISDQFIIDKPYDARTIKLLPGATGDLERMKKIYEMEKKKAELKQPINPLPSSTGNGSIRGPQATSQRKGG